MLIGALMGRHSTVGTQKPYMVPRLCRQKTHNPGRRPASGPKDGHWRFLPCDRGAELKAETAVALRKRPCAVRIIPGRARHSKTQGQVVRQMCQQCKKVHRGRKGLCRIKGMDCRFRRIQKQQDTPCVRVQRPRPQMEINPGQPQKTQRMPGLQETKEEGQ